MHEFPYIFRSLASARKATVGLHMTHGIGVKGKNKSEKKKEFKLSVTNKINHQRNSNAYSIRWEVLCVGAPTKNINCYKSDYICVDVSHNIFENLIHAMCFFSGKAKREA